MTTRECIRPRGNNGVSVGRRACPNYGALSFQHRGQNPQPPIVGKADRPSIASPFPVITKRFRESLGLFNSIRSTGKSGSDFLPVHKFRKGPPSENLFMAARMAVSKSACMRFAQLARDLLLHGIEREAESRPLRKKGCQATDSPATTRAGIKRSMGDREGQERRMSRRLGEYGLAPDPIKATAANGS